MSRPNLKEIVQISVQKLFRTTTRVSASQVAKEAGVSRQTALTHLGALVDAGRLTRVGRGRSAAYEELLRRERWSFPLSGLEEHVALEKIRRESALTAGLTENAARIFDFVVQEMINNAIDHSQGTTVEVQLALRGGRLVFEIIDDGVGALAHVKEQRHLGSELEAVQDLSKGKLTTAPRAHTGQGIFFSSRSVDRFELEAGELRWTVDVEHDDVALAQVPRRAGTLVRCTLDPDTARRLKDVFDTFSDGDFGFTKTSTWIRLFESGLHFLSRSEARRVAVGLDQFEEATLDFKGVTEVGQSFCDELFRVWARAHPNTRLVPANMVPAVEFMVRRALA